MVLPDTSIWIPYFRESSGDDGDHLEELIGRQEVAICGPVLAELLAGADEAQQALLRKTARGLLWADLERAAWQEVGVAARRLRQAGETLPLTDLTIAVAAVRSGCALWTLDSDFQRIAAVIEDLVLYESA